MEIVLIDSNQKEPMIDHFKAKLQSQKLRNFLLQYRSSEAIRLSFTKQKIAIQSIEKEIKQKRCFTMLKTCNSKYFLRAKVPLSGSPCLKPKAPRARY